MMRRLALSLAVVLAGLSLCPMRALCQGLDDNPQYWYQIHQKDIHDWAAKSGLPVAKVQGVLNTIEKEVDEDVPENGGWIQKLDARSLASRGQILIALTAAGTGHALSVYVVRSRPPYAVVWDAGEAFVTESILGEAIASVSQRGEILVKMPDWNGQPDKNGNRNSVLLVTSYGWTGKTYRPRERREYIQYRWNGRDYAEIGAGVVQHCR